MMHRFDKMFNSLGRHAKQQSLPAFMNLQQKKSTPIRKHMTKVITYLNEPKIDTDTQILMVLNILVESFNQFRVD